VATLGAEFVVGMALPVAPLRAGERMAEYAALAVFDAAALPPIEPVTVPLRTLADTF
jgi:hypothetical protein